MKTAICPISYKRINENVARGNAALTVILLASYLATSNLVFIAFLLFDFLLRAFELSKYSPLTFLSGKFNETFHIPAKTINAGPKIFSARIGFVFSVLILVSALFGWNSAALVFAAIFGVCAFLEAAFAYCVACEVYPFVYRLFYKSEVLG